MSYLNRRLKDKTFTFDYNIVTGQGKPTRVTQGLHEGFSLPVFNSDDEELFTCDCIPSDWDGVSNLTLKVGGWLDTANTSKNFQLQVSVNCVADGAAVGTGSTDIEVETATGTAAQYTFFVVDFTFDAAGGSCSAGNALAIRIRRIAASENEITGEFVVKGMGISYYADVKL